MLWLLFSDCTKLKIRLKSLEFAAATLFVRAFHGEYPLSFAIFGIALVISSLISVIMKKSEYNSDNIGNQNEFMH